MFNNTNHFICHKIYQNPKFSSFLSQPLKYRKVPPPIIYNHSQKLEREERKWPTELYQDRKHDRNPENVLEITSKYKIYCMCKQKVWEVLKEVNVTVWIEFKWLRVGGTCSIFHDFSTTCFSRVTLHSPLIMTFPFPVHMNQTLYLCTSFCFSQNSASMLCL
jgi:hypothetical protein